MGPRLFGIPATEASAIVRPRLRIPAAEWLQSLGPRRRIVRGGYAAHRGSEPGRGPARYAVTYDDGPEQPLAGVQWADWTRDGRSGCATSPASSAPTDPVHHASSTARATTTASRARSG